MSTFAVQYVYVDDPALLDRHRPEHRAFLGALHEAGTLRLAGPWLDEPAGALLDDDPFLREGAIMDRIARPWNVVFGTLEHIGVHPSGGTP